MGDYQVLFSGEVAADSHTDTVRARLARELGIDDRKARALFSGRTVVIRSQLSEEEARELQVRFADLGAMCRIKSLGAPRASGSHIDKDAMRMDAHTDQTLKDITAAHVECPRCGHMQLEASHCTRCGVDIGAALTQKRKEDLLIEKKIRELRTKRVNASSPPDQTPPAIHSDARTPPRKRTGFVRELFRRS